MEVNLSYVGNEEEDSRPIYKTYIMEGTKFCAMVLRELKKKIQNKTKTLKCSHFAFGETERSSQM